MAHHGRAAQSLPGGARVCAAAHRKPGATRRNPDDPGAAVRRGWPMTGRHGAVAPFTRAIVVPDGLARGLGRGCTPSVKIRPLTVFVPLG